MAIDKNVNVAAVTAAAKQAAAGITDPVAAAKAYRLALNNGNIHNSDADNLVEQAFPAVSIKDVNPHHLGGFANDVHQVGGAVGDVAKVAAPIAAMIPGVGLPIAAAISAGGTTLGRLNDKNPDGTYKSITLGSTLGDAAKGAGRAVLGHEAGGAIQGLVGGGGAAAGAGASTLPTGAAAASPNILSSVLGTGGGGGGTSILDKLLSNPQILLAGAGIVGGAAQQTAADKQRAQATQMATDEHNTNMATKQAVIAKLLGTQPSRPDLSAVFADRSNPYR